MAIRIVTDSSADLPPQLAQGAKVAVIPCNIIFDDVSYKDGVDISSDAFYQRLVSSSRLPSTAQPSAADFETVYRTLLDQGHQIVSIHLSSKLSGTLNSAMQARGAIGDSAPIAIIDSQLASIALGLVVLQAAQVAETASSYQEVGDGVRLDLPKAHAFFLLDTLEYLQKGGRIGKARAFVGSLLSIRPILKLQDGEAHPVERLRNRERAVARMVELARELAPVRQIAVVYSTEMDQAEALRHRLGGLMPEEQIVMARFGPALGTYLGPGALGVSLIRSQ